MKIKLHQFVVKSRRIILTDLTEILHKYAWYTPNTNRGLLRSRMFTRFMMVDVVERHSVFKRDALKYVLA